MHPRYLYPAGPLAVATAAVFAAAVCVAIDRSPADAARAGSVFCIDSHVGPVVLPEICVPDPLPQAPRPS